jgi:hypothetical protein
MQKAGIVALAPSALIPTLGPIICIGLVGAALFKLLKDDDLDSDLVNGEESSAGGQKVLSIDSSSTPRLEESVDAVDCDLSPKFPPALYGVLGVKSLALGRHLVHRLSLQKLHWRQVPQG